MTDPKQLHALADEELTSLEANALREALKNDPRAAAEVDAILNLKDVLARSSMTYSDEEVWKGCVRRLDAIDKSRRVEGFVGRYAWALCGAMFVFIISGRYAMRNVQGDTARTADLARIFGGSSRPVSAETQRQSKMYAELTRAIKGSLDSKELQVFAPLFGHVHDLPAARYPMRDRDGDLVLVQVDGNLNMQDTSPLPTNPKIEAGVSGDSNCLVWHKEGQTFMLFGSRSLDDLGQVAARIPGAQ